MAVEWPWFILAGLGAFHGLNPAMGWLFAVALGLHRGSRRALLLALPPIAAGHALSVALLATSMAALSLLVDAVAVHLACGAILIVWAGYHWFYGHRYRVRVGMTAGMAGLASWSFLMASAHGAGLMLMPALLPLCATEHLGSGQGIRAGLLLVSLAAVAVHTAAALIVTGLVALIVFEWVGLTILRQGWINFDLLWTGTLIISGLLLVATA